MAIGLMEGGDNGYSWTKNAMITGIPKKYSSNHCGIGAFRDRIQEMKNLSRLPASTLFFFDPVIAVNYPVDDWREHDAHEGNKNKTGVKSVDACKQLALLA